MFGLRMKVVAPLAVIVLALGALSWFLVSGQLGSLQDDSIENLVSSKRVEIAQAIDSAGREALGLAASFSKLPVVLDAFELASSGNISDPQSPQAQTARMLLREELAPALAGYEAVLGSKMKLHFHLPNGRSLVRLWREKQTKRSGQWVDISDDISDFRQTVLDVNESGLSVAGIELGRGGFVVRGLAPVKTDTGTQLGSVETLVDFGPILEGAATGEQHDLLLYMNADKLSITTRLQDPEKNPVLGKKYVQVSGTEAGRVEQRITPALLDAGRKGVHITQSDGMALATFPVTDYKGDQIGVMVYALDTSRQAAIVGDMRYTLGFVGLALLIIPVVVAAVILSTMVIGPVRTIVHKIKDIAEDRADLRERLDDSQNDEIGELATWFNKLLGKIDEIMCATEGYVNMINSVPDPIFAVDDDFKIIMANTATEKILGKNLEALQGECCYDLFQTEVCKTDKCPIAIAKKTRQSFKADIIDLSKPGKPLFIQPVGDVLKDCHGQDAGYFEVARNVTDLVLKEREQQKQFDHIKDVNEQTGQAGQRIAATTGQLVSQMEMINEGASLQRDRAAETATSMEQMNATVLEVARNAGSASEQADATRQRAMEGAKVVEQSVEAIGRVREQAQSMKQNMDQLTQRAEGIGQIMNVITDIADQTNLLALNAAIEAARAGEAGRGFAVVADEVRKLAEKTMTATKEVGDAITAIQDGARSSSDVVDEAVSTVEEATKLAQRSGESLQEIVELVNSTSDQVRAIATAAEEQSAASDEINRAVEDVNRIANETAGSMGDVAEAVSELSELAEQLRALSEQ